MMPTITHAARRSAARPIHVMQVVYALGTGGSERVAYEIGVGLDRGRFRSSVSAVDLGGDLEREFRASALPAYVLSRRAGVDWRVMIRLYRLFRRTRVDVVQTHHLTQLIYSGIGARLAGARLVHVEHEYFSLQSPKAKRHLRALAPLCHAIVAVGETIKEFLVREVGLAPASVSVIRNGVDVARYSPVRQTGERFGWPPECRVVGHVARLEPEKDQRTLLDAFGKVVEALPSARLALIGDGTRRAELERHAASLGLADRVRFLGARADVADLLPSLDVFVLSSLNEGLPLALLEAMACGRPVVATAVGEIPRVVADGVTGILVPPANAAVLASAIASVLQRPEWAASAGRAARRAAVETFSLTQSIQRYVQIYDTLLSRNGASSGRGV